MITTIGNYIVIQNWGLGSAARVKRLIDAAAWKHNELQAAVVAMLRRSWVATNSEEPRFVLDA